MYAPGFVDIRSSDKIRATLPITSDRAADQRTAGSSLGPARRPTIPPEFSSSACSLAPGHTLLSPTRHRDTRDSWERLGTRHDHRPSRKVTARIGHESSRAHRRDVPLDGGRTRPPHDARARCSAQSSGLMTARDGWKKIEQKGVTTMQLSRGHLAPEASCRSRFSNNRSAAAASPEKLCSWRCCRTAVLTPIGSRGRERASRLGVSSLRPQVRRGFLVATRVHVPCTFSHLRSH